MQEIMQDLADILVRVSELQIKIMGTQMKRLILFGNNRSTLRWQN